MKIWKWILGLFTLLGGAIAMFAGSSKKNKRIKEIKKEIKTVDKNVKVKKEENEAIKKSLESKKEALKEIEKSKYKKKDVSSKDASNFLKNYKGKK